MPDEIKKQIKASLAIQCWADLGLSQDEILSMIPKDTLAGLRKSNPHPYFRAYSICHEGVAKPRLIGEESHPIIWLRRAIQSIKNVVSKGVKFFSGHNSTNKNQDAHEVGEVVASKEMEINGELHHVVVGYFPKPEEVKDFDVCSHEGEWDLIGDGKNWIANKLESLTGIALMDSSKTAPAFDGAQMLGMVQAGEAPEPYEFNPVENKRSKVMAEALDLSTVAFDDIKKELVRRNTFPHNIYSFDDIVKDREFSGAIDAQYVPKAKHSEALTAIEKDKAELAQKLKEKERAADWGTAPARVEKIAKELNLTANIGDYIKKRLNNKIQDLSDTGLRSWIDEQIKLRTDVLSAEGGEPPAPSTASTTTVTNDFTKAANNPMLAEDLS